VSRVETVLGGGVAGVACALFAARLGPVRLYARPRTPAPALESVPAATLTLLLELGITPAELGVHRLTRERVVAWDSSTPVAHDGPACAHVDRSVLHNALWARVERDPAVTVTGSLDAALPEFGPAGPGWIDATGCRAVTAAAVHRPPRTWTAATVTVPLTEPAGLRLAAAPDGYAYLVGGYRMVTVGWVGPGRPPRDAAELGSRIDTAGAGWLLDGTGLLDVPGSPDHDGLRPGGDTVPAAVSTVRRPAGLAIPVPAPGLGPISIGDAALTRDALASQGLSIGLSDACLAARSSTTPDELAARRADAARRHVKHLREMIESCRFAAAPAWAEYTAWLRPARPSSGRLRS